ncbi:MAG TPA: multidrug ABC transporter ATP-binding protein [Gammaproteobacteria bacterium]|jgi:ABC-2 type transport system ATP-binding protein|nr:ABC transporter ATP-binding protein [Pseudomonadota bacterium]HAY47079.1 multidrug ABC transporter ATP-binding protein [Gammaproteobacteria bacterium]
MTEYAIDVHGLVKRFGDKAAVNGISIQMPRGQVWGFLGPNGSGKTTTIRMICGLLKVSEGSGTCLNFDIVSESKKIKALTGYMTQKFSFWEDLTIRENIEFVGRLYQLEGLRKCVDQTLETLGLIDRQYQLAGDLSGGWKQRMALAAVTMHKPELLLLDEPTAGVDPQARREFWDQIHNLTSQGMTVLVSTHYMDEAERCDEIVYLANGQLITQGRVNDIIDQSGLVTFRAEGVGVRRLSEVVGSEPGVDYVSYFGSALHVSGADADLIERALKKVGNAEEEILWEQVRPSLEDTFIALMGRAGIDERSHT